MRVRLGRLTLFACALVLQACESQMTPGPSPVKNPPALEGTAPTDEVNPHMKDDEHPAHESTKHRHEHGGHHADEAGEHHGGEHHRFEDAEMWSKVFDDPKRDAWQKPQLVVDWLGLDPKDKIAAIGAGTGYFAVRFASAVPEGKVFGTDVEASMVEFMTRRAETEGLSNLVAVQGSGRRTGLLETVDLAFACNVYHHIDDRPTYFKALGDQLSPKGRLVIIDFDPDAPDDAPGPPKAMRLSPEQVIRELGEAGFMLSRRSTEMLPYQYALEFTRSN